jgi:hypothetical protein
MGRGKKSGRSHSRTPERKLTASGSTVTVDPRLVQLRGNLPQSPASARAVAALTENPGCSRRRVIDAAGIPAHVIADRVGFPATRGQSPFAITSGNSFEDQLKTRSKYAQLAEALRPFVDLPEEGLRVEDLNNVGRILDPQAWKDERVRRTNQVLARLADGAPDAPHIVDHPMLVLDLAGSRVYLEPDALAFRVGSELELVEIKSYPVIDGQADPQKVSATAGQSAVYLLALRAALQALGKDPDILRWSVILVAPRNFGRYATAHRVPLRKKAMSIQRVLDRAQPAVDVLAALPTGFTVDVDPDLTLPTDERAQRTAGQLGLLAPLFVPECLSSCDLAGFCRDEAIRCDNPSRLGRQVRDTLGNVDQLNEALTLARMAPEKVPADLVDVAASLRAARSALTRARESAPAACGVAVQGTGGHS